MNFSLPIAYWCLIAAALLPFVCAYIAKAGSFGPGDNVAPREWVARLEGWRGRANAAQANSFEGLPLFIGAVIVAHQLGAVQSRIDLLAVAYVVLRLVFIGLYVGGWGSARSAVWTIGLLVNLALFFVGR